MEGGDLSDVAVVAHLLQNRLAAVTGAAQLLRSAAPLSDDDRGTLLDVVERSTSSIQPAIELLQRGLPAAALAELSGDGSIRRVASGVDAGFPVPDDEEARVAALRRYEVLDQPVQPDLDRIARLAARLADAPAAFVNLIDSARQWAAAAAGGDRLEVPRCDSMCAVTVAERRPVVVADASVDPVYSSSPWVTGVLGEVKLYASIPLLTAEGHAVGTLCVIDERPRTLAPEVVEVLADLAALAMGVLEARLAGLELRRLLAPLAD